jgi:hypothetical protein
MKKLLFILLFISSFAKTQTIIAYDYMETWTWAGIWWSTGGNPAISLTPNGGASTWGTAVSVSPNESAVIYGAGNGSSFVEQDWYTLPNITGLDPNKAYQFRFRLASYTFTAPSAATRGVDVADLVEVQVSTNGGVSYVSELRVTGNNNARWNFTSTGLITHTANGSFTNSPAPLGDVYQAPSGISTTGPSTIMLDLPLGITQVAVDILCRINSAGEEWWLDNIELVELNALPIELVTFTGTPSKSGNIISWETASESNTDYYLIERSLTGEFTEKDIINVVPAAGNSTELLKYVRLDKEYSQGVNYYQLTQVDRDGNFKIYGPISIDNTDTNKQLVKTVNMLGQEVDENYKGIVIIIYDDGTTKKVIR